MQLLSSWCYGSILHVQYWRYSVRIVALLSPKLQINQVLVWKCINFFSSTLNRINLKTLINTGHFGVVFDETRSAGEITWLRWRHRFGKASFCVHGAETKSRRFQIPRVWRAFSKAPFSWRISVDGRPNRRNKAVSSSQCSILDDALVAVTFFMIYRHTWSF